MTSFHKSGTQGAAASKNRATAALAVIAVSLVVILFVSYYYSVARKTDICFDGAYFLQPIVALERFGVLTQTYDARSPDDFHLPLNLAQGMLSQAILNWPFIHFFGINHLTLQAANLIFLLLGGVLMYLLVMRFTGNRVLSLAGVLLFFMTPQMKALGLQGLGEVPGAFYLLVCALLLHIALTRPRYFWWLGIAVFLAYHTKTYLFLVYPMILVLLGYLWLRQRTVRFADLLRFSAAFWAGTFFLPLVFIVRYGWDPFLREMSEFWGYLASTQWGVSLGRQSRDPELIRQAVRVLSANYGGWYLVYIPIAIGHLVAVLALILRPREASSEQSTQAVVKSRLLSWLPVFDTTQAVLLFLLGLSVFYVGYWYHFSTWAIWYRRIFPFLIIQIPLWLIACDRVWKLSKNRVVLRTVAAAGFGALLLLGFAHVRYFVMVYGLPLPEERALGERIEATEVIRSMPAEARLFGIGWWQAPKLSLFSGRNFLDMTTTGEEYNEGYLILDREAMGIAAAGVAQRLSSLDTKVVWENASNRIIEWKRRRIDVSRIRIDPSLKLLRIGPDHSTTAGERFYAQKGGTFAMWAATDGATPKTLIVWNGLILHSTARPDGKLMTAMVPRALFSKPGSYPITLYDPEGQRRSESLPMLIK